MGAADSKLPTAAAFRPPFQLFAEWFDDFTRDLAWSLLLLLGVALIVEIVSMASLVALPGDSHRLLARSVPVATLGFSSLDRGVMTRSGRGPFPT